MPYEYGLDLPSELVRINSGPFVLQVASGSMQEVRSLAGKTGRRAAAARFVLNNLDKMRQKFGVEEIASSGPVDDWIIKHCSENKETCVATNDVPLRKRLLALGVPVIAMKGKSKLDFV
jgi:rRNA-processing protein FCF1